MISHLEFCADWLNFTGKHADSRLNIYEYAMVCDKPNWQDTNAVHGYQIALINRHGCRVMWHTRRTDMGIHIMYSGRTLNSYALEGLTTWHILEHHAFFGDICKRIDLALDARDLRLNISKLYRLLETGAAGAISKAKSYAHITSSEGETLYLGSRTSEQFMRIYDKGAQMGTSEDWKRIELELKGSRAIQVARDLTTKGRDMGEYARQLIKGYADFPDDVWRQIVGDLVIMVGKAKDESPDTYKWLLTQVAPAMAKYMNITNDATVVEKFLAVVHSLTDVDNLTSHK